VFKASALIHSANPPIHFCEQKPTVAHCFISVGESTIARNRMLRAPRI
jgi:hypothetical protein